MKFNEGDQVIKFTGDYEWAGEVRSVFTAYDGGPLRYVVAHPVGRGRVLHIYSGENLKPLIPYPIKKDS